MKRRIKERPDIVRAVWSTIKSFPIPIDDRQNKTAAREDNQGEITVNVLCGDSLSVKDMMEIP